MVGRTNKQLTHLHVKNLLGIGGSIFTLDELRAHSELHPPLSEMLIYAYYYYWIENTLKFLKLFELYL